jgi:phenylacetate-CoA ligase
VNIREWLYFWILSIRGQNTGANYRRFLKETRAGIPADSQRKLLVRLLDHCKQNVPYYRELIRQFGEDYREDPVSYIQQFPILTKDIIRQRFEDLKSADLPHRHWYYNTSGGSTGEPARFIQDWEYDAWIYAGTLLFAKLVGSEVGLGEILLWGSMHDIIQGSDSWQARAINRLTNTTMLNSFRMSPETTREYIRVVNRSKARLITAYVETLYQMATFAEQEDIPLHTDAAIISSAGMLYPFIREKVEKVFGARVYNRYGSREVGDIACERPDRQGLWVAPWMNWVEIVDPSGRRLPEGNEGEILVTSLGNYAMPLIRYQIGDRGILAPGSESTEQVLQEVVGRSSDIVVNREGTVIHGGYLAGILYYKDWIKEYQVVQKQLDHIRFRIVPGSSDCPPDDLGDITAKVKLVMGEDCRVDYEFLDEIPRVGTSGKFRFLISEIQQLTPEKNN